MINKKIRNIFSRIFAMALIAALLSINLPRAAAVGNHLDTSFHIDGRTQIDLFGDDIARGVAVQTDGKIILAGNKDEDFAVVRLNSNGSLDDTFNGTGTVVTPVIGDGEAHAVAIQPDGKIVVAGQARVNNILQFALVRYNTNGSLDTTFDGNGFVYTVIDPTDPNNISRAHDVTVQPDGKIVAAGFTSGASTQDWALTRYNTNGSLDTTFGGDGRVITDFGGNGGEIGTAVVILPGGKIIAGGETSTGDFALVRYNANGSLDTTFNGTGKVTTDLGGDDNLQDIELQPDGKIIGGGNSSNAGAIVRYNANGTLDRSFDVDGIAFATSGFGGEIVLQPDGKIVIVLVDINADDFLLARLNPNGSLDAGFGQAGRIRTPVFGEETPQSVAIQADGKLIVAGYSRGGSARNFAVARYLPDMGKPFDFDNDGKTDLSIFRPPVGEWWYLKSSNGGNAAAQFGQSTDKITPGDFTGDGKSDIAFFRPSTGFWYVLRSEDFSFYSFPFGVSTDIPAVGDFDGDSKVDAAVFRPSTVTWYISNSSGGTTIQQFGSNGDVPAVGDYDGDGKADIAIFRPSLGQWWIQRSQNGSVFAATFGSSTDKPVQGDYTGDGKTDIAIWRPSTGEWFVLRSENQSFYSFPFGTNGDVPVPGDYDGDGTFDAAVFRPSTSTWYAQRTTAGTLVQQFGQSGDKPVPSAFIP